MEADKIIDASNKLVIPGGIDPHTHMELPFGGTSSSDDFFTGTRAAAFGGTTTIIDFAVQNKGESMLLGADKWHAAGITGKGVRIGILDLGFAYLSSLPLWNLAEPVMQELVEELKESCSAAVLDGADIVYVLRVPTHKIMSINLGIGSRLPAACTSMGRMLLAELDAGAVDELLRRHPLVARTARTITDAATLHAELARVRAQGWCLVDQELEEGLVSLAVPIRDRAGRAIAAMNVSGQAARTPAATMVAQFLPRLQAAAAQISQFLQAKA